MRRGLPPKPRKKRVSTRMLGTNPRSRGTNPRAKGTNPKALGTNPRDALPVDWRARDWGE